MPDPATNFDGFLGMTLANGGMLGSHVHMAIQEGANLRNGALQGTPRADINVYMMRGDIGLNWPIARNIDGELFVDWPPSPTAPPTSMRSSPGGSRGGPSRPWEIINGELVPIFNYSSLQAPGKALNKIRARLRRGAARAGRLRPDHPLPVQADGEPVAGHRRPRQPRAREPLRGGRQIATVLFYRDFKRFTGGDLKVWDYFNHVRSSERHTALVRFTADSAWDATNPWTAAREHVIGEDDDVDFDVLFLSGIDWRGMIPIEERDEYRRPIINLVQHVWHACPNDPAEPPPVPAAQGDPDLRQPPDREGDHAHRPGPRARSSRFPTGSTWTPSRPMADAPARDIDVLVAANKRPELGRAVAARLRREGRMVELVDQRIPRWELVRLMGRARVSVLVPNPKEGFYLPALEGMAVGTVVVCPDCIGNRSFCLPGENCFRPEYDEDAIVAAAETALREEPGLDELRGRAPRRRTAHDIADERAAFLDILDGVEELWAAA